jgi:hypothetical protein
MGQRSIRKTTKPIGITSRGVAVFAISGGQPPEDDDKGGDKPEDKPEDDVSGGGSGDKPEDKPGGTGDTVSKEEFESLKARMAAADKRADEAAKKVKEYEDKDKGELEKATERVTELENALAEKDKVLADLRFENAFALNPKHSWQDPSLVLDLLRKRDDVTIEDDGTVKGLDKALDAIAKEKKYLLKDTDDTEDDDTPGPSGSDTGSGKRQKTKTDEATLAKKYPALNV